MKFFKLLKKWTWFNVAFMAFVILMDNLLHGNDLGLLFSTVIACVATVDAIFAERGYKYDYPVNHPDQNVDEQEILGGNIKSILSVFMCVAPVAYGNSWVQSLAILVGLFSFYAVWVSTRLYYTTKNHVKYVG